MTATKTQPAWRCVLIFRTQHALTQEGAMEFWRRGSRFRAAPGPRTYEWRADVLADDPDAALTYVGAVVREVLLGCGIVNHDVLEMRARPATSDEDDDE